MKKIPIKLIENHDQAYRFWKRLGLSNRPLVHLDAHIDFNFPPVKSPRETVEEAKSKDDLIRQLSTNLMYKELNIKEASLTNIGNYIYPAMRDGIVSDFYWVIPGDRQEFNNSLKNIRNILKSFFYRSPFETRKITKEKGMLKAKIYKRNIVVTTLEDFPDNVTGALLDIDADFLTIDTVRKAGPAQDVGKRFPWIWPQELVTKLNKKNIQPSYITIAYSVNGGFTPLVYKFLGDELAIFFENPSAELKEIILVKNKALVSFNQGKVKEAIDILENILRNVDITHSDLGLRNKLKAHIAFILFRCFVKLNNLAKAKFYYNLAVTSDKTYNVKDNNYGPLYLRRRGNIRKAEQEFKIVLLSDRNNSYALSGLAKIFMRRRNFKKAKMFFKKAYRMDKKNQEAILDLGRAELRLKKYKNALKILEDYKSPSRTQGVVHSLLAQAYEGLGRIDKALEEYKLAHRFGMDLNLYLKLFMFFSKINIPQHHRGWIENRIKIYENYKNSFFKLEKRYAASRWARNNRIKRLINRLDNILEKIRERDG